MLTVISLYYNLSKQYQTQVTMLDKGARALLPVIRKIINTAKAPKAIAPYNQAVLVDRTLYVSGVLGMHKDTMKLVDGGIKAETKQALQNLGHVLEAGGSNFANVVKVNVFLKDVKDIAEVNKVYCEYFKKDLPARCAYQVAALPLDATVEIEVIAVAGEMKTIV